VLADIAVPAEDLNAEIGDLRAEIVKSALAIGVSN
jgi:hypothetical protein